MRIACLQFAPQVGDVDNNLNRADAVLSRSDLKDIDLLVLPELAFSGYNFRSLHHISPFLEPTAAGISSLWARTTALKYDCSVVVGYPEKVDVSAKWPANPEYYNAAIMVNQDGETVAHYRKSFLYYTDETWALEGPAGFYHGHQEGLGSVAMGICMDLNPYKFEAPWTAWEFARHVLHRRANLIILSMAWQTREEARSFSRTPKEPDMETLSYWLARLEPLIRQEGEEEIIAIFANRSGVEEEAVYAGTSAVLGIKGGEVKVYEILGRGERELLVVDTSCQPQMMLVSETEQPVVTQASDQQSRPELRCSTSSAAALEYDRIPDSEVLFATSDISVEPCTIPAVEKCTLTPISAADNTSPQVYFRNSLIIEHATTNSAVDPLPAATPSILDTASTASCSLYQDVYPAGFQDPKAACGFEKTKFVTGAIKDIPTSGLEDEDGIHTDEDETTELFDNDMLQTSGMGEETRPARLNSTATLPLSSHAPSEKPDDQTMMIAKSREGGLPHLVARNQHLSTRPKSAVW